MTEEEFCSIVEQSRSGEDGCEERTFTMFIQALVAKVVHPASEVTPSTIALEQTRMKFVSLGFYRNASDLYILRKGNLFNSTIP